MWVILLDVLLDVLIDGAKLLPFLLGAYLLIEWIEHRGSDRLAARLQKAGRFGPLIGSALGLVPQCGFSVAAANFYAGGVITPGTLVAVFIATSDEAIPVFLAHPDRLGELLPLLLVKALAGILSGFAVDLLWHPAHKADHDADICVRDHCGCQEHGIFRSALHHTLKTFAFILLVMFALGLVMEFVSTDTLRSLLIADSLFQPFLTALIGFIPNCAASVLLTQLYLDGALSFGALAAGLCTGAGVGLAVLLRMNRSWRQNLTFLAILYLTGAASGLLLSWVK